MNDDMRKFLINGFPLGKPGKKSVPALLPQRAVGHIGGVVNLAGVPAEEYHDAGIPEKLPVFLPQGKTAAGGNDEIASPAQLTGNLCFQIPHGGFALCGKQLGNAHARLFDHQIIGVYHLPTKLASQQIGAGGLIPEIDEFYQQT